jgi:N-acetylmuramoyl-L-alanine amidase
LKRWLAVALGLALGGVARADQPIPVEFGPIFEPEGKPLEGLVITVDAGHGGSAHQPGYSGSARGVNSRVVEGDLNMQVAILLDHMLRQAGARVHLTRRDDRKVVPGDSGRAAELGARTALADKTSSHLFLSLHHNSAARESADGVVMLIWPKDNQGNDQPLETAFATALEEELRKLVPNKEDFPFYEVDHPLVSGSEIPSAVVEFGFLSNPDFDAWVSKPQTPIIEAEAAYRGVERMWREHRAALESNRSELFPDAPVIQPPPEKPSLYAQSAKTLWPSAQAPTTVEDLNRIIELYKRLVLSDRTLFHVDASFVDRGDGTFRLDGRVNHPRLGTALVEILRSLGAPAFETAIEVLPSTRLGEARLGIVQIPMALIWSSPQEGIGVQTQLLMGQPVWLLDKTEDGSYFLLQGVEGYLGWVRAEAIRTVDAEVFEHGMNAPKAFIPHALMIDDVMVPAGTMLPYRLEESDSATVGPVILELPRGFAATEGKPEARVSLDKVRFIRIMR